MKENELMIGDWVQNPLGWKAQVKSIRYVNTIKDEWEWLIKIGINNETFQDHLSLTEIEPIPLTPEILEKNAFKFDGSGQFSMMFLSKPQFAEGLRFNIYVGLKRKTIEVFAAHPIEKSPNWRKSNKVYLEVCGCYVHELQHALRLCGIEKEIML